MTLKSNFYSTIFFMQTIVHFLFDLPKAYARCELVDSVILICAVILEYFP